MQGSPFSRSIAMFHAIAAAMSLQGRFRSEAMANIGSYESRGKGKGMSKVTHASTGKNSYVQRAAKKHRNVLRNRLAHR